MDAPEDRDLTLQRASADLLAEFGTSLPKFLYKTSKTELQGGGSPDPVVRKCVREHKTDHLVKLVWFALGCIFIL